MAKDSSAGNVAEPIVYVRTKLLREQGKVSGHFLDIFAPDLLRTTLLAGLLAVGAQGGYYALSTWLPTFLKLERGLSVISTGGYMTVIIIGAFVGYLVRAHLADMLGRRMQFIVFAVGSLLLAVSYMLLPISNQAMLFLGFPLGFFTSGLFSGIGAFFTELFPSRIRGSGQGFCYNFGRGIGALFPAVVGFLSQIMPLGQVVAILAASAFAIGIVAAVFLPETRGKQLAVGH